MTDEQNTQSWGSLFISSLSGILFGPLSIICALILIVWNEGNSLHTAQALIQAQQILIIVPSSPIDKNNNERLVYITGLAKTADVLHDDTLHISVNAIQLHRKVEMYQWNEEQTPSQTQPTYSYQTIWSDNLIDSSHFKEKDTHLNPATMPLKSQKLFAQHVQVGDFHLTEPFIVQITGPQPYDLSKADVSFIEQMTSKPAHHEDISIYVGKNSHHPEVGDLRIGVSQILEQPISAIGQQFGDTLQTFVGTAGKSVDLLVMGVQSPAVMIQDAQKTNQEMMWFLRFISLALMFYGFILLMKPFTVLADIVPLLGGIVAFGATATALICSLLLWALATALSWIYVRPWAAVILLAITLCICCLIIYSKNREHVVK